MKHIVMISEILINPTKGIVKQTIWYSDGSIEENEIPKYPPIIIWPINCF